MFQETGVYIRAKIGLKWESVDIADPRLSTQQLRDFLEGKDKSWIISLVCVLLNRHD